MAIDRAWHDANRMGRSATLDERVAWHLAHTAVCGCRLPPAAVVAEVEARGLHLTTPEVREAAAELRTFALGLPEAWEDHPWGEDVVKVRKKIFVFLGMPEHVGEGLGLGVKLPETGDHALSMPECKPSGYGLGRSGWVSARFGPGEVPPVDLLLDWIEESYRAVAPKTLVARL